MLWLVVWLIVSGVIRKSSSSLFLCFIPSAHTESVLTIFWRNRTETKCEGATSVNK